MLACDTTARDQVGGKERAWEGKSKIRSNFDHTTATLSALQKVIVGGQKS